MVGRSAGAVPEFNTATLFFRRNRIGGVAVGDYTPESAQSDGDDADFLRHELLARLAQGPVKWQFCVQLFLDEDRTPVNDASKAWDSPSVVIGELVLARGRVGDVEHGECHRHG